MSTSMQRTFFVALLLSVSAFIVLPSLASAQSVYGQRVVQQVATAAPVAYYSQSSPGGGGLLEFLFSGGQRPQGAYQSQPYEPAPGVSGPMQLDRQAYAPAIPAQPAMDPRFEKRIVDYTTNEAPGTIVIDTPSKYLYLVEGGGKAMRYGIGVGKPGFEWAGIKHVSGKREWPDWTPPAEMLRRRPDLPRHMEGGPENPLGARAMYLGSSLYRIHGSNEPWTIGTAVSSGCIRMRNEDVIDLYDRVRVGAKVIVS
jgi:lipoprotein-anchoring transpeptidase ErfK/SrfK